MRGKKRYWDFCYQCLTDKKPRQTSRGKIYRYWRYGRHGEPLCKSCWNAYNLRHSNRRKRITIRDDIIQHLFVVKKEGEE